MCSLFFLLGSAILVGCNSKVSGYLLSMNKMGGNLMHKVFKNIKKVVPKGDFAVLFVRICLKKPIKSDVLLSYACAAY